MYRPINFEKRVYCVATNTIKIQNISFTVHKFPYGPLHSVFPTHLCRQPLICFLSLQIVFSCCRISCTWNHQYMLFITWFLSLSKIFFRCIMLYISVVHCFLLLNSINKPQFLKFICWWTSGLFPVWKLVDKTALKIHV